MKRMISNPTIEEVHDFGYKLNETANKLIALTYYKYTHEPHEYKRRVNEIKRQILQNLVYASKRHAKKACIVYLAKHNEGTKSYPNYVTYYYIDLVDVVKETPCYIWNGSNKIAKSDILGYCNIPKFGMC